MRTQADLAGEVVKVRALEQTLRNRMHRMADVLELERASIMEADCEKCTYLGEILRKAIAACRNLAGERYESEEIQGYGEASGTIGF